MVFDKELIFTGISKRKSKNTEKEYLLANFLDDEGVQFSALLECSVPDNLKQLQPVKATFDLKVGRYMSLSVGSIVTE